MSELSTASSVSVSLFGEEMDFEKAIDEMYNNLQDSLNQCHTATRELNMLSERDEDFETLATVGFEIIDFADKCSEMFSELDNVIKQVVGRPTNEADKLWYADQKLKRKKAKMDAKNKAKEEKRKEIEEAKAKRQQDKEFNENLSKMNLNN